jgi:hypothetical protein
MYIQLDNKDFLQLMTFHQDSYYIQLTRFLLFLNTASQLDKQYTPKWKFDLFLNYMYETGTKFVSCCLDSNHQLGTYSYHSMYLQDNMYPL